MHCQPLLISEEIVYMSRLIPSVQQAACQLSQASVRTSPASRLAPLRPCRLLLAALSPACVRRCAARPDLRRELLPLRAVGRQRLRVVIVAAGCAVPPAPAHPIHQIASAFCCTAGRVKAHYVSKGLAQYSHGMGALAWSSWHPSPPPATRGSRTAGRASLACAQPREQSQECSRPPNVCTGLLPRLPSCDTVCLSLNC